MCAPDVRLGGHQLGSAGHWVVSGDVFPGPAPAAAAAESILSRIRRRAAAAAASSRRAGPGRAELPRTPAQSWAAILANHGARQPREISINVLLVSLELGWAAAPPLGLVRNRPRVSPRAL